MAPAGRGKVRNDVSWNELAALLVAAIKGWMRGGLLSSEAHCALGQSVDPPLEASKGSDHEDTSAQALGEEILGSYFGSHLSPSLVLVLGNALHGHEVVHGLGGDGAEDTSKVTRQESDSQLSTGGHIRLLDALALKVLVDSLSGQVESNELDHGVGN
jgi:hypothetical protein